MNPIFKKSGKFYFILLFAFTFQFLSAQDIKVQNPSFEDRPHFGGNSNNSSIKDWFDCGKINFPTATPPDIHQGINRDTAFWDNEVATSHGKTYLGLVVRDNESWESVSQRLSFPLTAGKCYSFSIFLARSSNYKSPTATTKQVKVNFIEPSVFRLWGGDGYCGLNELLCESEPINHNNWEEYKFKLEPSSDHRFITIEAFYDTPVLVPYNGHILLDNMSSFDIMECDTDVDVYLAEKRAPATKVQKKMPAHKAKKKKQEVYTRGSKENKVDTIVYKKPEKSKILSLKRENLKRGQEIRIKKLYFEADTSTIGVESYEVLNELYDFLQTNDDIKIEIGGHTNGIPSHDFCNSLSTDRAKAVAKYLIGKGIDEERLTFKGYGKRKPIASNNTPVGRKKNQRVEIKIISIG